MIINKCDEPLFFVKCLTREEPQILLWNNKKMMTLCIFKEDKWNKHAWLSDKFHIEKNLHYEIVMETKFAHMENLGPSLQCHNIISCSLEIDLQLAI